MRSVSIPRTKLHPPYLRRPIVPRPRLGDALHNERPLTIVMAPAGSGKTTSAIEWLEAQKTPVAWLSLDADDNDPVRFLRALVEALQLAGVKLTLPSGQRGSRPLLTAIINQLQKHETVALILDDYHVITDTTIHEIVSYLLDHMPVSLRLVLLSREEPPLPLPRLRARGQLHEIDLQDLRFTIDETRTFLTQVMKLDLSAEQIHSLEQRTQGWIAGLQMAALSLQADETPSIPAGTERQWITDYLLTEILRQQEPDVQDFLLNTSILDSFSAPLCSAVVAHNASRLLAKVQKNNLFITNVGDWYQYHPLFREFLQAGLHEMFPERIPDLHRRAMQWFEQNGRSAEAIAHAFAIDDHDAAARLISSLAPEYLKRGELVTLRRWLKRLPESVLWAHPRACLTQIWLLLDSNDSDNAQNYFDRLGTFLEKNLRSEFLAVRALHAAMNHQPEAALKLARRAQKTAEAHDPFIQTYVSFGLGAAQKMGLDFFQAEQSFRNTLALADTDGNSYMAIAALVNLADVLYLQARLFDAENVCRSALQRFGDTATDACDWYWDLSRIACQRNELGSALELVNRAVELSANDEQRTLHTRALLQRAIIHEALRKKKQAHADLDAADGLARGISDSVILRAVIRQRVLSAVEAGDLAAAQQWLDALTDLGEQPFPFYNFLARGRLLLAQQRYQEANMQFTSVLESLEDSDYVLVRIEASVWQAVCLGCLGKIGDAGRVLKHATRSAQTERILRPFVEARTGLLELLEQTGRSGFDWVADLLQGPRKQAEAPALTRREREILQLFSMGLSNQEMAERLVIAEGTLKRHIANLYQKLGVHNRAQALRQFHLQ